MSSMIPIFLMPIAVVDSVHILSEFADLYPHVRDRREAVREVVRELYRPMLYTSLTSAAGFASLALTPIPPVRVFGVFVAIGIVLAFVLTLTFVPAYIVLMSEQKLERLKAAAEPGQDDRTFLARALSAIAPRTLSGAKPIVAGAVLVAVVSAVGISRITINDNPVRWFRADHEIRIADRVLNEHFAGTYNAFLVLRTPEGEGSITEVTERVGTDLAAAASAGGPDLTASWARVGPWPPLWSARTSRACTVSWWTGSSIEARPRRRSRPRTCGKMCSGHDRGGASLRLSTFQDPVGAYLCRGRLQEALVASGLVGKSTTDHRHREDGPPRAATG